MSFRRLGGVLAGAAAIATLGSSTGAIAAPVHNAAAPPRCTVTMHVQSKIIIAKSTTNVPVTLTGCTNRLYNSSAQVLDPHKKFWGPLYFTNAHRKYNAVFNVSDAPPLGTYRFQGVSGQTTDVPPQQIIWGNEPKSILKLGTRTSVGTARHGSKVTISVLVQHYSGHGWVRYAHKQVGFQVLSHGKWKTIGFGKTNSTGRAGLTHTARTAAYYRAFITSTGSYWGSSSNRSRR